VNSVEYRNYYTSGSGMGSYSSSRSLLAGIGGAALGAAVGIAAFEGGRYLIRNAAYGYIPYGSMQTPYFFSDSYANTYYTNVSGLCDV
jgi:hypothetical protein